MTIVQLVAREHRRVRALHLVAGVAAALAASAALFASGSLLLGDARWMALPRALPLLVWAALATANVAVFVWARRALRTRGSARGVAEAIEREQALRSGSLRAAMEVAGEGPFGRAAAERLRRELAGRRRPLAPSQHRGARLVALRWGAAAAATIALLAAAAPIAGDGLMAILHPVDAWRGTLLAPPQFVELPPALVRGESLDVRVVASGRRTITLHHRTTGSGWSRLQLAVDGRGEAVARLAPRADLALVATDGRSGSDTAMVRITDRPFVGGITLRAVYPAYLGRAPEMLPSDEPLRVPRGTVLHLAGRASTALTAVALRAGYQVIALRAEGHRFGGSLTAGTSVRWSWFAQAASGAAPDLPPPLDLEVVPDSAPQVALLGPQADTVVAADDRVSLQISASDDHGLRSIDLVTVHRRRSGERGTPAVRGIAAQQGPFWSGTSTLELSALGLRAGDALHLTVIVTDDSPWSQRAESRELVLRVPTTEERRELVRDLGDSLAQAARSAVAAQQSLARRTEELSRSRDRSSAAQARGNGAAPAAAAGGEQAMQHRSAEQARALAQEQRALGEQVSAMRDRAAALERQLEQAGALDTSLARQLRDAQQLLRDALTPELAAQMQKLESAAQQLQGDAAREALRDLAEMQRRMKEQLEKSAEMLRRAALEGAMQTLGDEATEIAQRERALADSASARPDAADASTARQLAERSTRLAESLEQLQKRLAQEKAEPGAQRVAQAQQRAASSEERMRRAADRAQSGHADAESPQGPGAQPRQPPGGMREEAQAAAQQMEQAAQAMRDARDAQVAEWKQELTAELDRAIQEMLQLAREEQSLGERARSGSATPEQLRGAQGSVQQGVDRTNQRLQAAARKSSLLSGRSQRAAAEAGQKVQRALEQLSQRRAGNAAGNAAGDAQRASEAARTLAEASEALNRAAASLARDRERANSASSASGFSEMLQQLQEMARRQGSINGQAQGLMGMPGGPGSEAAQALARALARQQRGIAQQLDEMGEGPGGNRAGELAREARQVADALDGGRLDAGTLARQQQLFRRLLDAGRSLEKDEREDQGTREARAAEATITHAPGTAATGKPGARFREPTWEELRGLSAEDRRAIIEYFQRINARQP